MDSKKIRVIAIEWFNSLDDKYKKSLMTYKYFGRDPKTLTGREIEDIYKQHIQEECAKVEYEIMDDGSNYIKEKTKSDPDYFIWWNSLPYYMMEKFYYKYFGARKQNGIWADEIKTIWINEHDKDNSNDVDFKMLVNWYNNSQISFNTHKMSVEEYINIKAFLKSISSKPTFAKKAHKVLNKLIK